MVLVNERWAFGQSPPPGPNHSTICLLYLPALVPQSATPSPPLSPLGLGMGIGDGPPHSQLPHLCGPSSLPLTLPSGKDCFPLCLSFAFPSVTRTLTGSAHLLARLPPPLPLPQAAALSQSCKAAAQLPRSTLCAPHLRMCLMCRVAAVSLAAASDCPLTPRLLPRPLQCVRHCGHY